MTTYRLHALLTLLTNWPLGRRWARAMDACLLTYDHATTAPPVHPEPSWWRGHSPFAVAVIVLIVFVSAAPFFAGYLLAPPGLHFTGAPTYAEDIAQHVEEALDEATPETGVSQSRVLDNREDQLLIFD